MASPLHAASPQPVAGRGCVTIEIEGRWIGTEACTTLDLQDAAKRAQARAEALTASVRAAIPASPSRTGLATPAGAAMRPSPLVGNPKPPRPIFPGPVAPR